MSFKNNILIVGRVRFYLVVKSTLEFYFYVLMDMTHFYVLIDMAQAIHYVGHKQLI